MLNIGLKRIKLILRSICAFWLFFSSKLFMYIPILIFKLNTDNINNNYRILALLSTFSGICVSICLFLLYRKDLIKEFKTFKKHILSNINTGLICWVTGLIIMIISNCILLYVFKSSGANNENAVQQYIKTAPLFIALDICLVGPFNEELVFRKAIKDVVSDKRLFVLLSFLIFGWCHVMSSASNLVDYLYIVPYGILGAVFAVSYNKTNTIFTSMTFHMIHNTALFLLSVFI